MVHKIHFNTQQSTNVKNIKKKNFKNHKRVKINFNMTT